MFRTTEGPSSGTLVQCLAKNYKNDSVVSVDMYKVGVMAACCHNTDLVHVNGQPVLLHSAVNCLGKHGVAVDGGPCNCVVLHLSTGGRVIM